MIYTVDLDECYNLAVKLARSAGEMIREAVCKKKNVETKLSSVDLVTETDKQVEDFLRSCFKNHFPEHCFIGEESISDKLSDAPTWIVDPVDGTMNFVHSFPHSCVSIGLSVNKNIVLGVVYNPSLDRLYTGVKDKGAYCNGKRLKASGIKELSQALVISEFGSCRDKIVLNVLFDNFRNIVEKSHGMRMMGSAALNMCAVASGEADAYFEYSIHCWDMAAGKIIAEEAGATVVDPEGGPLDLMARRVLCTSSRALADTLSKELLHSFQFQRDQ